MKVNYGVIKLDKNFQQNENKKNIQLSREQIC